MKNIMLEYCIILKKSPDSYFTQSKAQLIQIVILHIQKQYLIQSAFNKALFYLN